MQVEAREGIFFPLPQNLYDFFRGIKVPDLVEKSRIDPVLSLLVARRLEELIWAVDGCLGW